MVFIIKPVNAQLVKDKDFFGKSVNHSINCRILTVFVPSDTKSKGPRRIREVERNHNGTIRYSFSQMLAS
jgi:hypothetical protein